MADALFTQPRFNDDDAAREHLEALRWPQGAVCPHCGGADRQSKLEGASHRAGLYFCGHCRSQYTVTVGTVFERSKVPLHKWVLATHLLCSSKKGMSSHQLHRILGVTYKTAWFMTHRIREAMKSGSLAPIGGGGKIVEVDETYWGNKKGIKPKAGGASHKHKILALVERNGQARGFHVADVTGKTLKPILLAQIARDSHLMTDEAPRYVPLGWNFAKHSSVNHAAKEYARGDVTTNTVEGYFSILKRGLVGTYHHVAEAHLSRYVTEFDFRYNHRTALGFTDDQRANIVLKEIAGKRLTYKTTYRAAQSPAR
jgi:transposase-like protein